MKMRTIAISGAIVAGIVVSFPYVASTKPGLHVLGNLFSGTLKIEKAQFSWFGPQEIEQFSYQDPSIDFECKKATCSLSLPTLLWSLYKNPLDDFPDHFKFRSFSVEITGANITVHPKNLVPISYFDIFCIARVEHQKNISLQLEGKSLEKERSGSLSLEMQTEFSDKPSCALQLNLLQVPLSGIDTLVSLHSPCKIKLQELFGSFLDLQSELIYKESIQQLSFLARSEHLTASFQAKSQDGMLHLVMPASLEWNLLPHIFSLPFSEPVTMKFTASKLDLPFEYGTFELDQLFGNCQFEVSHILMPNFTGSFSVAAEASLPEKISGTLIASAESEGIKSEPSLNFSWEAPLSDQNVFQATLTCPKFPSAFLKPFVPIVPAWIEGTIQLSRSLGKIELSPNLESSIGKLSKGTLQYENKTLYLSAPLEFTYLPSPEASGIISQFVLEDFSKLQILNSDLKVSLPQVGIATCHLEATSCNTVLATLQIPNGSLEGTFTLDLPEKDLSWKRPISGSYLIKNELISNFLPTGMTLSDSSPLIFKIEPSTLSKKELKGEFSVKSFLINNNSLETMAHFTDTEGSFRLLKEIINISTHSQLEKGSCSFKGDFSSLNCSFLKGSLRLTDFPIDLLIKPYYTGTPLDLTLTAEKTETLQSFTINAKSPICSLSGGLLFDPKKGFSLLNPPLLINYELSPELYRDLRKLNFDLKNSTLIQANVKHLTIPFKNRLDFASSVFDLVLTNNNSTLVYDKKEINLSKTNLEIHKESPDHPLLVKGALVVDEGSIILDLSTKDPLALALETSCAFRMNNIPALLLDVIYPSTHPLSILFTPTISGAVEAKFSQGSGPLQIVLSSKNANMNINGSLEQGKLILKDPATASLNLTKETSKFFTDKLSLVSQTPIKLTITPQKFSFPILPFRESQIEIGTGRLSLGKIFCSNEGNINATLGILKSKQASERSDIETWFAPADFHIHQGILSLERTEFLLARTYDLAIWGQVNLVQNSVQMILGLTAPTLRTALGLQGLPQDYVLQLPLKGTLSDIVLDTSAASKQVMALMLWQTKSLATGGKAGNALFGGILDKVIPPPGSSQPTPPPKPPFPWQK